MPSMVSRQAVRDKHNNLIPAKRQHTYIYTMSWTIFPGISYLQLQVSPDSRTHAAVLWALQSEALLQQGVCQSGLAW